MTNSAKKAALVLKSLPKAEAAQIMGKLEASDIKAVMDANANLAGGDKQELNVLNALHELSVQLEATSVRSNLRSDKPHEGLQARHRDSTPRGPFHFLLHLNPGIQNEVLQDEHPENIALVLANLPAKESSQILNELDPAQQVSVVKRLCELSPEKHTQLDELAVTLKKRLGKILQPIDEATGIRKAGQLLSCTNTTTRQNVLEHINQHQPHWVKRLKSEMLEFEAIVEIDNLDIQILLKQVNTALWAPALKSASQKVRDKILKNVAAPVAKILSTEISEIHEINHDAAQAAQSEIINICIGLAEKGRIQLPARLKQKKTASKTILGQ